MKSPLYTYYQKLGRKETKKGKGERKENSRTDTRQYALKLFLMILPAQEAFKSLSPRLFKKKIQTHSQARLSPLFLPPPLKSRAKEERSKRVITHLWPLPSNVYGTPILYVLIHRFSIPICTPILCFSSPFNVVILSKVQSFASNTFDMQKKNYNLEQNDRLLDNPFHGITQSISLTYFTTKFPNNKM